VADSIAGGQDLPLLALMACTNGDDGRIEEFSWEREPYQVDHYSYWFSRDLSGYIRQRKNLTREEKRLWLKGMMRSLARADSHIMWQPRDPVPALRLLTKMAGRFVRAALPGSRRDS
jgi:hypothetical protein